MFIESYRASMFEDGSSYATSRPRYLGLAKLDAKFMKLRNIPPPTKSRIITEQLLPSGETSNDFGKSILRREVYNEDINIKVLLLSPWLNDAPPFVKSVIDLYSRFGSIGIEVIRLSGLEQHFFRLYVTSCERDVKVLLPVGFRGVVSVDRCKGSRIKYSTDMCARIKAGLIRVEATAKEVADDEDEVHIHAPGRVELRLMDETSVSPSPVVWYHRTNGTYRLRRLLGI